MIGKIKTASGKTILVDNDFMEKLSQYKWNVYREGAGAGYAKASVNKKQVRMHRFIMNCPKGKCVDHINGNTLDNRKINLRICTNSQNMHNCSVRKNCKSGLKGVKLASDSDKRIKKWISRIRHNGKELLLGYFLTKEEAARVFDIAAKKYHGNFARTNYDR